MTRRDYVALSSALKKAVLFLQQEEAKAIDITDVAPISAAIAGVKFAAQSVCDTLQESNPNHFDTRRFMIDAGFPS